MVRLNARLDALESRVSKLEQWRKHKANMEGEGNGAGSIRQS